MYRYGQYCPIARAVELLGDRWTLLIIRDLLTGSHHFNELFQGLPGISKALLSDRLRRLTEHGIVEKRQMSQGRKTTRYVPTQAGRDLQPVIAELLVWGARWSFGEPDQQELDPLLLMWWIQGRVLTEKINRDQLVIEFDFRGADEYVYWLVVRLDDVSLCVKHPGFEVDVEVSADLSSFYQVWMGRMDFEDALATRRIKVDALPVLRRDFPKWFGWSLAAPVVRAERLRQE